MLVKEYKLLVTKWICSGGLTYSMVTIVNNNILYTWQLFLIVLTPPTHTQWLLYEVMNILISLMGIIIIQGILLSKQHTVYLKCIQFLSITPQERWKLKKLENEKEIKIMSSLVIKKKSLQKLLWYIFILSLPPALCSPHLEISISLVW